MRKLPSELLQYVELEDLRGESRQLAETIGIDAWRKLVDVYGGSTGLYIPKAEAVIIPVRDKLIQREYNGDNAWQLALEWNLTERTIREIVKEKAKELRSQPLIGQMTFDQLTGS